MRLAELFVELSFKVNGAEDLTKFDDQMKSIASSARDALAALRALARVQLPREFIPKGPGNAPGGGVKAPGGSFVALAQGSNGRPTVIQSAQILIQSAKVVILGGGVEDGSSGGGVIPGAGGESGGNLKGLAKLGLGALGFATILTAIRSLVSNLKEMVQTSRQAAFATDKLTASTGLSRRELKQWEYVANKANLGEGVIQNTLQKLTANREALRYGRGNPTHFLQFGIDWTADAGTQLRQFFQRTARDTQAQAEQKAEMLGMDPSIVYARRYLDQAGNLPAGTELSDKQQKSVMELNAAWQEMTFNAGVLASKITSDLSPAITRLIEVLNYVGKFYSSSEANRVGAYASVIGGPVGTGISNLQALVSLLPKAPPARPAASVHTEVNVTNHGTVPEIMKNTGKTVTRAVSDAMFGVHPAFADR